MLCTGALLPTVKSLQGLHWQELKSSKPIRFFWYAFGGMFFYEFFPAYIFPWLNSVSIPCLASMHATGDKAAVLTNLFGGALNNEGLGLFSSFIRLAIRKMTLAPLLRYRFTRGGRPRPTRANALQIGSFNTSLPLKLQAHSAVGFLVCFRGHAWHLLHQCLGCAVPTFHVDEASIGERRNLPLSQRSSRMVC